MQNASNSNTGDNNTGYCNTGDRNTGNWNTGDWNTGDWNTGYCNTGKNNAGNCNTGEWNTGYWNGGNRNTGIFNTDEPNARFFGKESNVKMSEFINSEAMPSYHDFDLTVWVGESMMTDEEKKDNPTYTVTGGYLKSVAYKEAWAVFWRKTSEENKQKFINLPNFCPKIFKEITGIDVEEKPVETLRIKD